MSFLIFHVINGNLLHRIIQCCKMESIWWSKQIFCRLHGYNFNNLVSSIHSSVISQKFDLWPTDPKMQTDATELFTRQLPMGAGYCPWGGHTDRIVCNIHEEVCPASRYCEMLWPRDFSKFGTLPASLAPCQYSQVILEETPCRITTFGKMPKIVGMLPKVSHRPLTGHNWPHTLPLSPKLAQKRHISVDNWPWPLTLCHKKSFLHHRDLPWCQIWRS